MVPGYYLVPDLFPELFGNIQEKQCCFFFNDTPTPEIYTLSYTLSLHDALSICNNHYHSVALSRKGHGLELLRCCDQRSEEHTSELQSHSEISYAVFCLTKKKDPSTFPTISWSSEPKPPESGTGPSQFL